MTQKEFIEIHLKQNNNQMNPCTQVHKMHPIKKQTFLNDRIKKCLRLSELKVGNLNFKWSTI